MHELISHSSSKRVPRRRPAGRPEPLGGLFQGILFEIRQRRAYCWADYMTALRHPSKTLAAALFMFFATLFSTVALGHLIEKRTKYRMGLSEYLTMNAISGVTHALIGTQPLLVLRPTGPITAITVKLADVADSFGYDFHQFMAATGLCVGLLMAISAATQISRHIKRLTPFTHDVFACFVCSIYLHDGVSDVLSRLDTSTLSTFGQARYETRPQPSPAPSPPPARPSSPAPTPPPAVGARAPCVPVPRADSLRAQPGGGDARSLRLADGRSLVARAA